MPATTNISYNTQTNSASIEFFSGAILVSHLQFSGGVITLSERPAQIAVTHADMIAWLNDAGSWIIECEQRLSIAPSTVSSYKIECNLVAGKDLLEAAVAGQEFKLEHITSVLTLKPRDELTMNWVEWKMFIQIHRLWLFRVVLKQL